MPPMPNGHERPTLAEMDVASRMGRLRARLAESGCDALLVTKLVNLRYLTGFTGSAGMLLVRAGDAMLLTDGRYAEQSAGQLAAAGVECSLQIGRPVRQLEALDAALKGVARLGLEAEHIAWGEKRRLSAALGVVAGGSTSLIATRDVVEALRVVKDAGELERIELAAQIADVALAQVKERLREGVTEREFARELDYEMRLRGADDVSFETIVASGPNGARPHGRVSERRIEVGELVIVDFGAEVDGYHSDMTRTLCVGSPASSQMSDLLDAVLIAQRAGVRALRPGVSGDEVDRACREALSVAGCEELFVHGTGHGVGLEIHESPALSQGSADILDEGVVVTVEPGVYVPGTGGVRIEDTLVVTGNGARALTKSTKDSIL